MPDGLQTATALGAALGLGLSSGFAPGPTLTLVVSQTLRFGRLEGLKVAIAPLITDAPIVALSLFVLTRLEGRERVLGGISIVGSVVLAVLAVECFRARRPDGSATGVAPRSVLKGALANALNPHPYLGWIAVVGPMTLRAAETGRGTAVTFVAVFYAAMVGSKMLVAVLVGRGGALLRSRAHTALMVGLGLLMLGFAAGFLVDGIARIRG